MPNIELLEKSMPVAPIRIAALGCRELAEEVDRKLVKFRKELVERKQQGSKKSTSAYLPAYSLSIAAQPLSRMPFRNLLHNSLLRVTMQAV